VSSIALLDVNVLVALFHPDHIYHDAAHEWFGANRIRGWATCPLTENGLLRILANSATSGDHHSPESLRGRLDTLCSSEDHVFWSDNVSLRDDQLFSLSAVSHRQISDIYLLGLAVANGGRLATFDRRIPLEAVINARRDSLEVIAA
jgi:toxin-antitoxin system PIN domain toxin